MQFTLKPIPQLLCILLVVCFFMCCKNNTKRQDEALQILQEGLANSTQTIKDYTSSEYHSLQEKVSDARTTETATIWYEKATKVRALSEELYQTIDSFKAIINEHNCSEINAAAKQNVNAYKNAILQLDKELNKVFDTRFQEVFHLTNNKDSGKTKEGSLSVQLQKILLDKMYNKVAIAENNVVIFCNLKSTRNSDYYDQFSPLISQNAKHFKAGDVIEIKAGIGAFSKAANPSVQINNKTIDLNELGFALSKAYVDTAIGKHVLPVKISYLAPDGEKKSQTFDVVYFVER